MTITDDPEEYMPFLQKYGLLFQPGDEVVRRNAEREAVVVKVVAIDTADPIVPYLVSQDLVSQITAPQVLWVSGWNLEPAVLRMRIIPWDKAEDWSL